MNMHVEAGNNLVVIDDEPLICEFISDVAGSYGFEVRSCCGLGPLSQALTDFEPSLVLLDLNMPVHDGVEVLRFLRTEHPDSAVMLMSGEGGRVLESALRFGQDLGLNMLGYLEKPLELESLETILYQNWRGHWLISEEELRLALDQGEFLALFQPRAHREADGSWRVRDVEALIRWQHPRFGLLTPEHFIPLAEELPMISEMTDLMLQQSVDHATRWLDAHGMELGLSINLPTTQLCDSGLPDRLLAIARRRGVDASRITLEVTERGTMRDTAAAAEILTRCRLKQFNLAMDDFGTGCSSLTHLAQLPFNELKIDKSFVAGLETRSSDRVIVRSCIALAHSLGLKVCAEGVESAATFQLLDRMGCDTMQGFWVSPAVRAADIPNLASNFRYQRL
ncbi:MAG: EAL domain-containing response regulator [Gammaproteobacteria bacterium]|nr:EAL domain-containing response regulator [Gammaproteobacteria bacterium]